MRPKLSNKSNGFTLVEVLLVLIFIGVVALIGLRVVDSQKQPVAATASTNQQAKAASTKSSVTPAVDALPAGEIKDLGTNSVTLTTAAEIEKLPSNTPVSFKEYMKVKLTANKPTADGCVEQFTVNKLSTVNVLGGIGEVEAKTLQAGVGNCGGGAKLVWSLVDSQWQENGFQALPECSLLVKAKIYEEFMGGCSGSSNAIVKNPNGSITQLKR